MRLRSLCRVPSRLRRALLLSAICTFAVISAGCRGRAKPWSIEAPDPASTRTTASGELIGGEGRYGAHAWLGIQFANPPIGPLRWRAPEPPAPWTGTRAAIRNGPPCPQFPSPLGGVEGRRGTVVGSEECLTLDVWAPRFEPIAVPKGAARLPVLVWIHGGGNTIGHTALYDGGNLATTEHVLVVAVHYRLGPFGWFRHRALRAEAQSEAERSGNFAILDLIRALEWVRENISAFGGDPGNVTIFGESAGGTNVFMLLLAPQARGFFQHAIVESGSLRILKPSEAENYVDDVEPGNALSSSEILLSLLQADGAPSREVAKAKLDAMSDVQIADYLRRKNPQDLLALYKAGAQGGPSGLPRVFGDGTVLPAGDPLEKLATADGWNVVPVMLGTNRDENRLFMFGDPARIRRVLWFLPRFIDEQSYLTSAEYLARMWKATGADRPAAAMRKALPSVFVYRFDWDEEPTLLGADLSKMLGAAHGLEIPFVFGHFELGRAANVIYTEKNRSSREALSRAMMSYWAQFAKTGAPGQGTRGDQPEWTAWDDSSANAPRYLMLDTAEHGGVRMASRAETPERILSDVDADPRLPTQRERCRVFRELAAFGRGFSPEQYPTAGAKGCVEFPFDQYPWTSSSPREATPR
jgi:para-nitrobenzyl esterase